jgi:hypothetical protein
VYFSIPPSSDDAPAISGGLPHTPPPFNSTQNLAAAPYVDEAVIVGGVLTHDTTDYSTLHLPVGHDYSGKRADAQFIDFFYSATSKSFITINITGTYSGIWIGMEGISDNAALCPESINGTWWDGY